MKRSLNRLMWLTGAVALSAAACAQGSLDSITSTPSEDTNPSSADNQLAQASVAQINDALSVTSAETGNTADVSASDNALTAAGCVKITTTPSPLDPNNLPLQFSITWTWANCPGAGFSTKSGDRMLTVNRDPNAKTSVMQHERDITWALIGGGQIVQQGNATIDSNGIRVDGAIARNVTDAGARHRTKADGQDVYNYTYDQNLVVQDTFDPNNQVLTQRVINGAGTINHLKMDAVTTVTVTDLTFQPAACCYPVAGSLEHSTKDLKNGEVVDRKFTFSSTCGQVTLATGQVVNYPACP